jgi:hypothetical protein
MPPLLTKISLAKREEGTKQNKIRADTAGIVTVD